MADTLLAAGFARDDGPYFLLFEEGAKRIVGERMEIGYESNPLKSLMRACRINPVSKALQKS
ncbi:MAG: hypothetical protein M3Z96_00725 [Pseudomonadota bacterium]|nr:hypothetical protein [Pseudomonadota bacterium]